MAGEAGNEGTGEGTGTESTEPKTGSEGTGTETVDQAAEAARWKALSRKNEADANKNRAAAEELQRLKDAGKSETEKLTGERDTLKGRAETAEHQVDRLSVALEKGLTLKQAARLVGKTRDELATDADELLADLGGAGAGKGAPPSRTPSKNLKAGTGREQEDSEETDPRKLAARVPRR